MIRALNRLLPFSSWTSPPSYELSPGTELYYFYKSSKQNEIVEWKEGRIIASEPNFVRLSTQHGRTTHVAYEDIRVKPRTNLARELSHGYVGDYIAPSEWTSVQDSDTMQKSPTDKTTDSCAVLLSSATKPSQFNMSPVNSSLMSAANDIGDSASRVHTPQNISGSELTTQKSFDLKKK